MTSIGTWWLWLIFFGLITTVLLIDILKFGGREHQRMTLNKAFFWSSLWISLALLFNFFLWIYLRQEYPSSIANQKALEFFTAYLVEKSLSLDNIFVFVLIFEYFKVPAEYQRRLLLLGVVGAIILRLVLITLGIWLLEHVKWIFYLFGLILVYSSIKIFILNDQKNFENNLVAKFFKKIIPMTQEIKSENFFIKKNNKYYGTPLFIVLILIETSDLIFAVDSIPAVFGITTDLFIVFTSNAFAILGLRALYFILADIKTKFALLNYGLSLILGFIGIKMILHDLIEIPVLVTLSVIIVILVATISASRFIDGRK